MDNKLQIFNNVEFGEVRTLQINNEPWFVGKDVATILGYANQNRDILRHTDEEDRIMVDGTQYQNGIEFDYKQIGQRGGWLINESGLYSLILSSKLPGAKKFKRWITSEVLPTIRKHGAYMTDEVLEKTLEDPDYMIGLLTKLKEEKNLRLKVEKERDLLIHDDKTYTTTELAKELGFRSARAFNQELHNRGIQYPMCGSWVLYSKYATEGYTELKQSYAPNGEIIYHAKWTGKGRYFLLKLFNKGQIA